ncbi:type II toxin-antitoxin system RelE/ParE family toxin [Patescibacteria group bacterium]|nr:type II toxin-antitoxin system RelE/ParE family toxin [Patescibacteria group bacterium]
MKKIEFSSKAKKKYFRLDFNVRNIINTKLKDLQSEKRIDIKKLQGYKSCFRLRVGGYRVLLELRDNIWIVFDIDTREKVYG